MMYESDINYKKLSHSIEEVDNSIDLANKLSAQLGNLNLVVLTLEEYNSMESHDQNTLYIING